MKFLWELLREKKHLFSTELNLERCRLEFCSHIRTRRKNLPENGTQTGEVKAERYRKN
jgi:hypothetical protein